MGPFLYTGQRYLGSLGLYHYKARMYHPKLGRFMQTDPIGYDDGLNMYAYVKGDPVNKVDPTGLETAGVDCGTDEDPCEVTVTADLEKPNQFHVGGFGGFGGWGGFGGSGRGGGGGGGWLGGPSIKPEHDYEFDRKLTKDKTQCTVGQVADAVARFAVPGNDGVRVQDDKTYPIKQAVPVANRFFGGPSSAQIQVGTVEVNIEDAGRTITNTTLKGHLFHSGSVRLHILNRSGGGYSLSVKGQGTNQSFPQALMNQIAGPVVFKNQISKIRNQLKSTCGG